jgi:hypothetical protein
MSAIYGNDSHQVRALLPLRRLYPRE